jgi:hypothetical protein
MVVMVRTSSPELTTVVMAIVAATNEMDGDGTDAGADTDEGDSKVSVFVGTGC